MSATAFEHTVNLWLTALSHYTFPQLLLKPFPSTWSLGQVYMHLIENNDWFFDQINTCISTNDNAGESATPEGKHMLRNNAFPDMQLTGPLENDHTPQPNTKEEIIQELTRQKNEIQIIANVMVTSACKGKTKHPGLGYFNASEWLQFAEMHMRHHLRQKKRLDEYLKTNSGL